MNSYDWIKLGLKKVQHGLYAEALSCYNEAEAIDPTNEILYKNLGDLYFMLGESSKAENSYIRSLVLSNEPISDLLDTGNGTNMLMRLGHALLDNLDSDISKHYRCSIDPHYRKKNNFKFNLTRDEIENYDHKCVISAYNLMIIVSDV